MACGQQKGTRSFKKFYHWTENSCIGKFALDKRANVLRIAAAIFLKDIGNACIKLGDQPAALRYFIAAKESLIAQQENKDGAFLLLVDALALWLIAG